MQILLKQQKKPVMKCLLNLANGSMVYIGDFYEKNKIYILVFINRNSLRVAYFVQGEKESGYARCCILFFSCNRYGYKTDQNYSGFFIDKDGNIGKFKFNQLYDFSSNPEHHLKLVEMVGDLSEFETIGTIEKEKLSEWYSLLSTVTITDDVEMLRNDSGISKPDVIYHQFEVFGVRIKDDEPEKVILRGNGVRLENDDVNAVKLILKNQTMTLKIFSSV